MKLTVAVTLLLCVVASNAYPSPAEPAKANPESPKTETPKPSESPKPSETPKTPETPKAPSNPASSFAAALGRAFGDGSKTAVLAFDDGKNIFSGAVSSGQKGAESFAGAFKFQ